MQMWSRRHKASLSLCLYICMSFTQPRGLSFIYYKILYNLTTFRYHYYYIHPEPEQTTHTHNTDVADGLIMMMIRWQEHGLFFSCFLLNPTLWLKRRRLDRKGPTFQKLMGISDGTREMTVLDVCWF